MECSKYKTEQRFLLVLGATLDTDATYDLSQSFDEVGLDELSRTELIMRLEDQFRIHIEDAEFEKIITCTQAVEYLHNLQQTS